jgi:hypothetical protein
MIEANAFIPTKTIQQSSAVLFLVFATSWSCLHLLQDSAYPGTSTGRLQ